MTRVRSAAGYWLNHVALTTDVKEKSKMLFVSPPNKERVKQEKKEAKTTERNDRSVLKQRDDKKKKE